MELHGSTTSNLASAVQSARRLRGGLELVGANTKIIPGHGPVATHADLIAHRDMLIDVRGKVAAGIASGRTLA